VGEDFPSAVPFRNATTPCHRDRGYMELGSFRLCSQTGGSSRPLPTFAHRVSPRGPKCLYIAPYSYTRVGSLHSPEGTLLPPIPRIVAIAPLNCDTGAVYDSFNAPRLLRWAEGGHQGSEAALSCRLCLIACNSRHGDEVGARSDR
jgi:hypothetical protein